MRSRLLYVLTVLLMMAIAVWCICISLIYRNEIYYAFALVVGCVMMSLLKMSDIGVATVSVIVIGVVLFSFLYGTCKDKIGWLIAWLRQYRRNVLISMDQLVNAICCGYPDETLSARSYRLGRESAYWNAARIVIDCIFFWQKEHCKQCWQWEQDRMDLPISYRVESKMIDNTEVEMQNFISERVKCVKGFVKKNIDRLTLLGAILILIAFCAYFHIVREHATHSILKQKLFDIECQIETVCSTIDTLVEKHNNWENGIYLDALSIFTTKMDAMPNMYAKLFDEQGNRLSDRIVLTDDKWSFDLSEYPELKEQFYQSVEGTAIVHCKKRFIDVYFYWRWIPLGRMHENKMLMIIGVTKYSVCTELDRRLVNGGIIALIIVAAIFIVGSLAVRTVNRHRKGRSVE